LRLKGKREFALLLKSIPEAVEKSQPPLMSVVGSD